jgi:hypothetical protein
MAWRGVARRLAREPRPDSRRRLLHKKCFFSFLFGAAGRGAEETTACGESLSSTKANADKLPCLSYTCLREPFQFVPGNHDERNTGTVRRCALIRLSLGQSPTTPRPQKRARQRKRSDAAGIFRGDFASIHDAP